MRRLVLRVTLALHTSSTTTAKDISLMHISALSGIEFETVHLSVPYLIPFPSVYRNPAIDRQAMARIWRDGAKKPVSLFRLLTGGTIEEKMFQRQLSKQEVASMVVEAPHHGKHDLSKGKFSAAELKELLSKPARREQRSSTAAILSKSPASAKLEILEFDGVESLETAAETLSSVYQSELMQAVIASKLLLCCILSKDGTKTCEQSDEGKPAFGSSVDDDDGKGQATDCSNLKSNPLTNRKRRSRRILLDDEDGDDDTDGNQSTYLEEDDEREVGQDSDRTGEDVKPGDTKAVVTMQPHTMGDNLPIKRKGGSCLCFDHDEDSTAFNDDDEAFPFP